MGILCTVFVAVIQQRCGIREVTGEVSKRVECFSSPRMEQHTATRAGESGEG